MGRTARKKSSSGIYHVMIRGINRQEIFEAQEDYYFFLNLLRNVKEKSNFELYAYCLMGNHVHLLVREKADGQPISRFMNALESDYAIWFNRKYERTGYLFQGRFKSEAVETARYFMVVFRYIHNNPVKACLVRNMYQYPWSSWKAYENLNTITDLVDREIPLVYFGSEAVMREFCRRDNEDICMDIDQSYKGMSNGTAKTIMRWVTGCSSASAFQNLDRKKKQMMVSELLKEGLSISQISRLCGVSRKLVEQVEKTVPEK